MTLGEFKRLTLEYPDEAILIKPGRGDIEITHVTFGKARCRNGYWYRDDERYPIKSHEEEQPAVFIS